MKVGIIECGPVPAPLQDKYISYPAMFAAQLGALLPGAAFTTVSVVNGETLPAPDACDAWLIPGSRHGVYDDLPWIDPLKHFIREAAKLKRPMAGVCFGHQIIAEALGGKVEKAAIGFRVGMERYETTLGGAPQTVTMPASHQDQVVLQPPDSEVVAKTAACAIAGLRYKTAPVLSVQFHPEFSRDYLSDLIALRAQQQVPPGLPQDSGETDGIGMRWIAEFLAGSK
jgi:GMP synthase-like glutamine amidotransferase